MRHHLRSCLLALLALAATGLPASAQNIQMQPGPSQPPPTAPAPEVAPAPPKPQRAAPAQRPANRQPVYPALLRQAQEEARKQCDGDIQFQPGFIRTINLTPDGRPDYILNFGAVVCKGSVSEWCGSGGCQYTFIVSEGAGYASATDHFINFNVIPDSHGDILRTTSHGSACGRAGYEGCTGVLIWQRGKLTANN